MNTLETFLASAPAALAGQVFLHFLWQGLAIAGLLLLGGRLLSRRSANARYLASTLALGGMALAPPLTALALVTGSAVVPFPPPKGPIDLAQATEPLVGMEAFVPALALFWLLGSAVEQVRLALGWWRTRGLRGRETRSLGPEWEARLARLVRDLGVTHRVRLYQSARVQVPTVIGSLRPVVLVPVSALLRLSPDQLEAVLAHELAHVRRHDYLVNLVQSVIEAVLFFHPAVHWVSRRMRLEREYCCDDLAIDHCRNPLTYARALERLESLRSDGGRLALASTGGNLMHRIQRLIQPTAPPARRGFTLGALPLTLFAGGLLTASAFGWNSPEPAPQPSPEPLLGPSATPQEGRGTDELERRVARLKREIAELEAELDRIRGARNNVRFGTGDGDTRAPRPSVRWRGGGEDRERGHGGGEWHSRQEHDHDHDHGHGRNDFEFEFGPDFDFDFEHGPDFDFDFDHDTGNFGHGEWNRFFRERRPENRPTDRSRGSHHDGEPGPRWLRRSENRPTDGSQWNRMREARPHGHGESDHGDPSAPRPRVRRWRDSDGEHGESDGFFGRGRGERSEGDRSRRERNVFFERSPEGHGGGEAHGDGHGHGSGHGGDVHFRSRDADSLRWEVRGRVGRSLEEHSVDLDEIHEHVQHALRSVDENVHIPDELGERIHRAIREAIHSSVDVDEHMRRAMEHVDGEKTQEHIRQAMQHVDAEKLHEHIRQAMQHVHGQRLHEHIQGALESVDGERLHEHLERALESVDGEELHRTLREALGGHGQGHGDGHDHGDHDHSVRVPHIPATPVDVTPVQPPSPPTARVQGPRVRWDV